LSEAGERDAVSIRVAYVHVSRLSGWADIGLGNLSEFFYGT